MACTLHVPHFINNRLVRIGAGKGEKTGRMLITMIMNRGEAFEIMGYLLDMNM